MSESSPLPLAVCIEFAAVVARHAPVLELTGRAFPPETVRRCEELALRRLGLWRERLRAWRRAFGMEDARDAETPTLGRDDCDEGLRDQASRNRDSDSGRHENPSRELRSRSREASPPHHARRPTAAQAAEWMHSLQEVLVGEMFDRVWCGVLASADPSRGGYAGMWMAERLFWAQLEIVNGVLQAALDAAPADSSLGTEATAFQRRIERWTDLLLAAVGDSATAGKFAFSRQRHAEFREDAAGIGSAESGASSGNDLKSLTARAARWAGWIGALRESFHASGDCTSEAATTWRELFEVVLSGFGSEFLSPAGRCHSPWMEGWRDRVLGRPRSSRAPLEAASFRRFGR